MEVSFDEIQSIVRRHGRLADRMLPNWVLANRHLADWSRLIDGLRVWEVGSGSDCHKGERCTRCNQKFHHGASPLG
jgi:hypothetical protein